MSLTVVTRARNVILAMIVGGLLGWALAEFVTPDPESTEAPTSLT